MHDTVIRNGTIVDGTGNPAFAGDVAIDGGRIAQVGGKAGPGKREINADGKLVTPGWVDVHTHYDGQATWDQELAPSSWHGATTLLTTCVNGESAACTAGSIAPSHRIGATPITSAAAAHGHTAAFSKAKRSCSELFAGFVTLP